MSDETFRREWLAGVLTRVMAARRGVTPQAITNKRRRLGLPKRPQGDRPHGPRVRRCPHCAGRISPSVAHHCEGKL